jgi:hypothetical protein
MICQIVLLYTQPSSAIFVYTSSATYVYVTYFDTYFSIICAVFATGENDDQRRREVLT